MYEERNIGRMASPTATATGASHCCELLMVRGTALPAIDELRMIQYPLFLKPSGRQIRITAISR
jgi:hypothetical protein